MKQRLPEILESMAIDCTNSTMPKRMELAREAIAKIQALIDAGIPEKPDTEPGDDEDLAYRVGGNHMIDKIRTTYQRTGLLRKESDDRKI